MGPVPSWPPCSPTVDRDRGSAVLLTLTRFPSLDLMLALDVPTPAVVGRRDPLMPGAACLVEIAAQTENQVPLVVIDGAAHAIDFTHPDEIHRGIRLPPTVA